MAGRVQFWLLAIAVPVTFGTGPCVCGPPDECDRCGEQTCEEGVIRECGCDGFGANTLFIREDCAAGGLTCTQIPGAAPVTEGALPTDFAVCMEACDGPGDVSCRGEATKTWQVCLSAAACGVEASSGDPDTRCVGTVRGIVTDYLEGEPDAGAASGADTRWLDSGMGCTTCRSSCECDDGYDCLDGFCVPGEDDADLTCCGRERLAPCPDGAACEEPDGSRGECHTVGHCEECERDADCASELCVGGGGGLSRICASHEEGQQLDLVCRDGDVWHKDVCDRWIRLLQECPADTYCEEGECLVEAPEIEVTPTLLVFGDTKVGTTTTLKLNVGNLGRLALEVSEIAVEAGFADMFTVTPESASVASLDIVEFAVTFAPSAPGEVQARLQIRSDDGDEPLVTVLMNGTAVP